MNLLRYALKNIVRNLFLSISSILTIGLLVFFVNILLLVVFTSNHFIASVNNKIAIILTFKDGYNNTQIRSQEFLSGATAFSGVMIEYISREDALEMFAKRHSDLVSIVEHADENPLPDSVRISQIPIQMYKEVDAYIAEYRDILQYDEQDMNKKLVDYQNQYAQVSKVVELLQLSTTAVYVLIWLFLFTVFVMIHTVIRNFIFFLQDEVRIIELVWGKSVFIYGPLMIQGVLYTTMGVLCAFCAFFLFKNAGGMHILPENFVPIFEGFYQALVSVYLQAEIGIALLIGVISAFLASYKYVYSTIRE